MIQSTEEKRTYRERVEKYAKRAVDLGIVDEELWEAGLNVGTRGLNNDCFNAILDDENGPAIMMHLHANESVLDQLVSNGNKQTISNLSTVVRNTAK